MQGTKRFRRTVESSDRLGVAPRAVTDIINCIQEDTGAVSVDDRGKLIDSSKIERDLNRERLEKVDKQSGLVLGLGLMERLM